MNIPWESLVVYTLGGDEVTDARRRRSALDAFRRNSIARDFHIRERGAVKEVPRFDGSLVFLGSKGENGVGGQPEQAVDLSILGPDSAARIDWTGFAPALPASIDLCTDAEAALGRGDVIRVERLPHHAGGGTVETLVVGGRAGQASGDEDAVWGDWDEESRTIRTDQGGVLHLDGRRG